MMMREMTLAPVADCLRQYMGRWSEDMAQSKDLASVTRILTSYKEVDCHHMENVVYKVEVVGDAMALYRELVLAYHFNPATLVERILDGLRQRGHRFTFVGGRCEAGSTAMCMERLIHRMYRFDKRILEIYNSSQLRF